VFDATLSVEKQLPTIPCDRNNRPFQVIVALVKDETGKMKYLPVMATDNGDGTAILKVDSTVSNIDVTDNRTITCEGCEKVAEAITNFGLPKEASPTVPVTLSTEALEMGVANLQKTLTVLAATIQEAMKPQTTPEEITDLPEYVDNLAQGIGEVGRDLNLRLDHLIDLMTPKDAQSAPEHPRKKNLWERMTGR